MTTQTEALKLADRLLDFASEVSADFDTTTLEKAADELRRLDFALAQPKPEPAFYSHDGYLMTPERAKFLGFPLDSLIALYTNSPQPKEPEQELCPSCRNSDIYACTCTFKPAQPAVALEQKPVAWMSEHRFDELRKGFTVMTTLTKQRAFEDDVAIYTTPPQHSAIALKPLTAEQREEIAKGWRGRNWTVGDIIDAIEAAHGIKE